MVSSISGYKMGVLPQVLNEVNPMNFTENQQGSVILEKLKMQKDEEKFCDVFLYVNNTKFALHRNILSSFSPYFERTLYSCKAATESFDITCSSPAIFQYFVNYMYTGSIVIHSQNVAELLKLAHRLEVSRLQMYCAEYLERYLDLDNCLRARQMSHQYCMPNLNSHVILFIKTHISSVLNGNELLSLNASDFKEALNSKDLDLTPIQILRAIMDWVKVDIPSRERHMEHILRIVEWNALSIEIIHTTLENEPLFSSSEISLHACLECLNEKGLTPMKFAGLLETLRHKYGNIVPEEDKKNTVETISKRKLEKRRRKKNKRFARGNLLARLAALKSAILLRKKLRKKNVANAPEREARSLALVATERNMGALKCHLCDHYANETTALEHHLSSVHARDVTYKCGVCGYVCQWNNLYLEHIRGHFPGPPYKCDSCDFVCEKLNDVMTHRSVHAEEKTFKCSQCSFKSRSQSTVANHSKCHAQEKGSDVGETRSYVCDHCGFSTKYLSHLIAHKRIHSADIYRCTYPQCKFTTGTKTLLGSHAKSHQGVRPHNCQICGRGFLEKSHLVRHERIHLEEKPFKCHECDYASSRRDKLKEHQTRHHGDHASAKVPYKARPNKKPQLYQDSYSPGDSGGRSNIQEVLSHHQNPPAINYSAFPSSEPLTHHSSTNTSTLDFHQQQLLTSTTRNKEHRSAQQTSAAAAVTAAMMLDPRFHHSVTSGGPYVSPAGIVPQPPGQPNPSGHQLPEYPTALMSLF